MDNTKLVYVSRAPDSPTRETDRLRVLNEEGWIRAFDTPPEDGQSIYYTFPMMWNSEFIGKYTADGGCFSSKHGFLCDDDVYWKPLPYEYIPEEHP